MLKDVKFHEDVESEESPIISGLQSSLELDNNTSIHNPYGLWVWVHMGTGMGKDFPTCKLQNKPLFI